MENIWLNILFAEHLLQMCKWTHGSEEKFGCRIIIRFLRSHRTEMSKVKCHLECSSSTISKHSSWYEFAL